MNNNTIDTLYTLDGQRGKNFSLMRIEIYRILININDSLTHDKRASINIFSTKLKKHQDHREIMQFAWYREHISGSFEHYLSELFITCSSNIKFMPEKLPKYLQVLFHGRKLQEFLSTDIDEMCIYSNLDVISVIDEPIYEKIDNLLRLTSISPLDISLKALSLAIQLCKTMSIKPKIHINNYTNYHLKQQQHGSIKNFLLP